MKTSHLLIAVTTLALLGGTVTSSTAAQPPSEAAASAFLKAESLGDLQLGMSAEAVVKLLGQPTKQGELVQQEEDSTYTQHWRYPAKGIELVMTTGEKKNGPKTVQTITATGACKLATRKGIKIGSGENETRKAYEKEASRETSSEEGTFVAGSVYGGIVFNFKKGKVFRIFFGAAAE